jgi:D-aspartate ligase
MSKTVSLFMSATSSDDIQVVIIGSDINAYFMARCYHEAYGKTAHLIAKEPMSFTSLSKILTIEYHKELWNTKTFVSSLLEFAKNNQHKKLVLIPSTDIYVRLINENARKLAKYYLFHQIGNELVDNLLLKDGFYEKFKNSGLDLPKTYIHKCKPGNLIAKNQLKDLLFPVVIKPSNGVAYYKHPFSGQAKVYRASSLIDLNNIISKVTDSGYNDNLIIQEFIPGDDDRLYDSVFFVNSDSKAELASFAQIGLQEHTSTGVGNCTVLVNGYAQHGDPDSQIKKMKVFLEKINYKGFAEFDLKYDERDNKYKVFEINPRQARSSYYLAAAGYNPVEYIVNDLVFNKRGKFKIISEKIALSFVPIKVIRDHIKNKSLKREIFKLKRQGKLVDPLDYPNDFSLKRALWLTLRKLQYIRKYKSQNWY